MKQQAQQVRDFMKAFGQTPTASPCLPEYDLKEFRYQLIAEEATELRESKDITEYADAIGDLLYVVLGAAAAAGIGPASVQAIFEEVHRSNMTKTWTNEDLKNKGLPDDCDITASTDGRYLVRRFDGKVIKSPSYSPAKITPLIA